jgi:phosphatidylinositol glycan class W
MAGGGAPLPLLPSAALCFAAVLAAWLLLVARRLAQACSTRGGLDAAARAALAALGDADHHTKKRRLFVSAFRGGLMLLTCASILAVDFRAFPRRLAKAENYGQGLMDVGVGAFVFAAGLVLRPPVAAAASRGGGGGSDSSAAVVDAGTTPRRTSSRMRATAQQQQQQQEKQPQEVRRRRQHAAAPYAAAAAPIAPSLPARLAKSLRASAPVAALGLVRLLTTKATQYAEHVGEYGVHWNFFLTVAAVGAAAAALPPAALATPGRAALLSTLLLAGHQALLSLTPLGAWVQAEARGPGWLSLNKEGVASLPGYAALLLLGAAAGGWLRAACDDAAAQGGARADVADTRRSTKMPAAAAVAAPQALARLLARGLLAAAAAWALALAADARVERVSRRACNAAYALWVSALCVSTLLACMAGEAAVAAGAASGAGRRSQRASASRLARPAPSSSSFFAPLLCALNRNMLAVFLGANLLTGAVNLLTDTLAAGDARARLTVALYLLAVGAAAAALDVAGVDTTRWLMREAREGRGG